MRAKEKRGHKRVSLSIPLQYKDFQDQGMDLKGTLTENLSEGGVNFKSTEFIRLSRTLVVEILPSLTSNPIKAVSKVKWIKKMGKEKAYMVGTRFVEIDNSDRKIIQKLSC